MSESTPVRRRSARVVATLLAVVVLLVPSVQAMADDDPGPVQWPKIGQPDSEGNQSDPGPVKWATIAPPDNNGTANDPQPVKWPEIQPPG